MRGKGLVGRCFLFACRKYSSDSLPTSNFIDPRKELQDQEIIVSKLIATEDKAELCNALNKVANLSQFCGEFNKSIEYLTQLEEQVKESFGPISYQYSSVLHDLGEAHKIVSNIDKAEKYLIDSYDFAFKANEIFNTKPTEDFKVPSQGDISYEKIDPLLIGQTLVFKSASSLATLYEAKGERLKAITYYRNGVLNLPDHEMGYACLPNDHANFCTLLNPIVSSASAHYLDSYLNSTLPKEKLEGLGAINTELMMVNEGTIEQSKGLLQALSTRENIIGKEHPALISSLATTAWASVNAGDLETAEDLTNRVLSIHRRVSGYHSPASANALTSLALINYFKCDFKESISLLQKAIRMKEEFYDTPVTLHLGVLHYDLGHLLTMVNSKEAMNHFSIAKEIFAHLPSRMAGKRHPWYQLVIESIHAMEKGAQKAPVRDFHTQDQPHMYNRIALPQLR